MGFLRKATIVLTGGAAGVAIKANSKKERTAKAAEKQTRMLANALKEPKVSQVGPLNFSVSQELRDLATLRDDGVLTDAEFEQQKAALLRFVEGK